jgi:hypothetical protein
MALNADWHRAHPMPKKPTAEERLLWHEEHARVCGCRKPSPKLEAWLVEARAKLDAQQHAQV